MSPAVWWPLLGAAISGTIWAVSAYVHWSFRFEIKPVGVVAETAFLIMLLALGTAALGGLYSHPPTA